MIFANRKLQFAKRGGKWRYYPHVAVLQRLGKGLRTTLKQAVYDSCIDVSFAGTGGCLAVLTRDGARSIEDKEFVDPDDWLKRAQKGRTKVLNAAIGCPFQRLDRRLRQRILAMDGATIIDHNGNILTAGAIIKVPGGSTGGGREAAARSLSQLGLGIKISADGPIKGFRKGKEIFSG